jgi:hypothetical protein
MHERTRKGCSLEQPAAEPTRQFGRPVGESSGLERRRRGLERPAECIQPSRKDQIFQYREVIIQQGIVR